MKTIIEIVRMQTKLESAGIEPSRVFAGRKAYEALEQEFRASQVVQISGQKRIEDALQEFNQPVGTMYVRNARVILAPGAEPYDVYIGVEA